MYNLNLHLSIIPIAGALFLLAGVLSPAQAADLVTVAPPCEFREDDINLVNLSRGHHDSKYGTQGKAVDMLGNGNDARGEGGARLHNMSCKDNDTIKEKLLASISGRVRWAQSGSGGNELNIENPLTDLRVRYLHLPYGYPGSPKPGAWVNAGDMIGYMGDTGDGPEHMHFEVWRISQNRKLSYKSLTDNTNLPEEWRFGNYAVQGPNLSGYDFKHDSQGWQIANNMSFVYDPAQIRTQRQPRYRITGNDPHIVSPMLNLARFDYRFVDVDLTYSQTLPASNCVEIYIMETGDANFSPTKRFVPISGDASKSPNVKLRFDLGQKNDLNTKLTRLRLDPDCGGNQEVTINKISLVTGMQAVAVHQFWSDKNQNHFYTARDDEKNTVLGTYPPSVWKYERIAFRALDTQLEYPGVKEVVPVYRFWSDNLQGHFYTIDESERQRLIDNPSLGWKYEFIAFKALKTQIGQYTMPLFRFWSDKLQAHFYTISTSERDDLINNPNRMWKYEGIVFYVLPAN